MLNLNTNDKLEKQPVVVRQINKKMSQNNKGYYSLQISYGIKNYDAKIWDSSDEIGNEITPGCLAYIWGVVRDFKGNIQIHINKIERINNPEDDLINEITPSCFLDEDSLSREVAKIIETINNNGLKLLLNNIFNLPEVRDNFFKKAAGAEIHHAYMGGLAQHTIEVAKTVINFCNIFSYINYDLAVTAALLHDIGKTFELSNFPENKYTVTGRLLGHIYLGAKLINETAEQIEGFSEDMKLELEHCILSHHGSQETGSPVLPMTIEAITVYNADRASAEINGFHLAIERDTKNDVWTDYNSTYKRFIKKSY